MIEQDESYAAEILADCGGPGAFDSIEIHGACDLPPQNGVTPVEVDDADPEYFIIHLHYCAGPNEGGAECVGDFIKHETALNYAQLLRRKYHWPIHDLSKPLVNRKS